MSVKHAFLSPPLCAAPRRAPSAPLPGSGEMVNQPSHKVTLGAAHNCITIMLVLNRRRVSVQAVDKDSQQRYDFDQEKARQALNELDQQLDSLLKKPVPQPKIRASNLTDTLRDQMKEEEPVFSGPALSYGAFALFAFTLLYNILFLTVIKPSIDIPDEVAEPLPPSREAPKSDVLQQQMILSHPLAPDILVGEL